MCWPNHYSRFSQAARLSIEKTSPTNFDKEDLRAERGLRGVKLLCENSIYPFLALVIYNTIREREVPFYNNVP